MGNLNPYHKPQPQKTYLKINPPPQKLFKNQPNQLERLKKNKKKYNK